MKKLEQKDLLLSPKVVTDLTGSGTDNPNGTIATETAVDCTGASDDGTCLTLEEEGCATDNCATNGCLTIKDTCVCTKLCNETHSQDVQCCKPTEQIDTRCCITPPVSLYNCIETSDCQETDDCPGTNHHCYYTVNCQETEGCQVTNSIQFC